MSAPDKAMTKSYRAHFCHPDAGAVYDEDQYAPGSFWDAIWQRERRLLDGVAAALAAAGRAGDYLDFACGTGRVLSYLEGRFERATGIDVSEEMLRQAGTRVKRAALLCRDVTVEGAPVEGKYDLVTAFRFLLNAEEPLRVAGLRALAARLRDRESRLVINTHGNSVSYKGLLVPARRALGRRGGDERLLSRAETEALLAAAGLEVLSVHGMGIVPQPRAEPLGRVARFLEPLVARVPGAARLGVNQVFVCRSRIGPA